MAKHKLLLYYIFFQILLLHFVSLRKLAGCPYSIDIPNPYNGLVIDLNACTG